MAATLVLLCACSGSQTEGDGPLPPTAEPVAPSATAEATASTEPTSAAAPTASVAPTVSTPPKLEASEKWQVESGSAKGLQMDGEGGQSLKIALLSFTKSLRQTDPLNDKNLADANVGFATITADGATAKDVVCKLPVWEKGPDGVALIAAVPALVIQDAAPTGAVLKNKKALLACNGGKAVRVSWTFEKGKVTKAAVIDGNDKTNTCVTKALEKSVALDSGSCVATIE